MRYCMKKYLIIRRFKDAAKRNPTRKEIRRIRLVNDPNRHRLLPREGR